MLKPADLLQFKFNGVKNGVSIIGGSPIAGWFIVENPRNG